ncbi:MAG: hypothetical protein M1812_002435 [Candelaria pacifica]|nr:MAG: hypothetical protein M1812_002435 [Candelaria pacifica]
MAEVSRLESIIANQQKGDFIGSISHELRSPLHGVLASSEFLSDTSCDAYQQSLVNTINSCGQTLLDTINHVLDFSKINSFKKNWRVNGNSSNRPRSSSRTRSNGNSAGATALLVETNVAVVIEQVIESVFAGRVYQDISTLDNDLKSTADMKCDEVSVHIDVTPGDWNLITQPGALRRVIMNLFGNALKYTARGWIKVRLTFENTDKETQSVQLTVTDTGKGISSEYLRTKLYTPFAQENSLAPGTGLGLSIVRSIVNMLEGEINIRSEIGSGTEVQVSIPMVKGSSGGGTPESALSLNNNGPLAHHEIVAIVRQAAQGKTFAIHGFGTKDTTASTSHNTANTGLQLLESYLVNWFGFKVASSPSSHIDIVVANETIVADLTTAELGTPGKQNGPILLVICKSSTRSMKTSEMHDAEGIVEVISEPIGPYKLANALEICLRRYNVQRGGVSMPSNSLKTSPDQLDKATPNGPFEGFEVMTLEDSRVSPALSARNDGMLSRPNNPKALKEQSPLCNQEIGEYDAPFPSLDLPPKEISPRQSLTVTPNKASLLSEKASSPPYRDNTTPCDSPSATQTNGSKKNSEGSPLSQNTQDKKQSPEILLVDDNLINLKLLETFMKKRKYQSVKSATNGLIAVEAYNEAKRFDVIFMDISMPIMDGFEATRAIRTIEQESRANSSRRPPDPPALIIALTGLASSRDQSEAFQSGVDLYMTKPVTFRDVGKLLDDWEMNKVPTPGEWPSSDTVVS